MKKYLHLLIALTVILSLVFSLAVPASAATLSASLKGAGEDIENAENNDDAEEAEEPADSEEPYLHTQQFLDAMKDEDLDDICSYEGRNSATNDDFVFVEDYLVVDDEEYDIDIVVLFSEDNEDINFRVWNLIDFDKEDMGDILYLLNQYNYDWSCGKFYVDETDDSVTLAIDLMVDADQDISDVAVYALYLTHVIAEDIAPDLLPYAK